MLLEELLNREQLIRDVCDLFYDIPMPKLGKHADAAIDMAIEHANARQGALEIQVYSQMLRAFANQKNFQKSRYPHSARTYADDVESTGVHKLPTISKLYDERSHTDSVIPAAIKQGVAAVVNAFEYITMMRSAARGRFPGTMQDFEREMCIAACKKLGVKI